MLVNFYHLSVTPIERVLPKLCEHMLGGGERMLIVAASPLIDVIDEQLWTYSRASFLPHGRGGSPDSEQQPVLLADKVLAENGASVVAIADGIWRDDVLKFGTILYLFDGTNIDDAREAWRRLKDQPEAERRYWKQTAEGKWVQGP